MGPKELTKLLEDLRTQLRSEEATLQSQRRSIDVRLKQVKQQLRDWETTKRFLGQAMAEELRTSEEFGAATGAKRASAKAASRGLKDTYQIERMKKLFTIIETTNAREALKRQAYREVNPLPPTIAEFALAQIRAAGSKGVTSLAITEQFNANRTRPVLRESVREALRRLAQDGLIERRKHVWYGRK